MRIKKSKSKNSVSYSIIKDYTKNGKRSTKIVDKIGNINYVTSLAEAQNITIEQWLENYLNEYIKQHTEETDKIIIEKHIGKIIPKNQKNTFNIGHLFLKDIYYDLIGVVKKLESGLDPIVLTNILEIKYLKYFIDVDLTLSSKLIFIYKLLIIY